MFVGDYAGEFVGTSMGPSIGLSIGFEVGEVLGEEVGSSVGTFVRLPVGFGVSALSGGSMDWLICGYSSVAVYDWCQGYHSGTGAW